VQIAKLRFFISLVVDQKTNPPKANLGIRPLPNLETKFVAANTLIGLEKPKQMAFRNPEIDVKEKQLAQTRQQLFTARTPETKRKYRQLDKTLRADIAKLLEKDGWGSATAQRLAGWDPYNQNAYSEFFDPEWMFGLIGGFDIVIANPPYVDSELMSIILPEQRDLYTVIYDSAKGNWDLFVVFIEKGIKLLKTNGAITYIVPNKLIGAPYSEHIKKIIAHYSLREIRDYSKVKVFKDADVYPITFVLIKSQSKSDISLGIMSELEEYKSQNVVPSEIFYKDTNWDRWFVNQNALNIVLNCSKYPPISNFLAVESPATVRDAYEIKKIQ